MSWPIKFRDKSVFLKYLLFMDGYAAMSRLSYSWDFFTITMKMEEPLPYDGLRVERHVTYTCRMDHVKGMERTFISGSCDEEEIHALFAQDNVQDALYASMAEEYDEDKLTMQQKNVLDPLFRLLMANGGAHENGITDGIARTQPIFLDKEVDSQSVHEK